MKEPPSCRVPNCTRQAERHRLRCTRCRKLKLKPVRSTISDSELAELGPGLAGSIAYIRNNR